jgi:hypothetical protein
MPWSSLVRSSLVTVTTLTALLVLLVATPSAAHVMMMPGEVEPGSTLDTEILVVHGCGPGGTIPATDDDASPTTAVTLEVPFPLEVTPHDIDGWSVSTDRAADGTVEIRWENEDETGTSQPIYLDVTVDATDIDEEQEFWLSAVQDCVDGERMYWTLPGMEERDGQLPGVNVGVVSAEPARGSDTGPSTALVIGIAVLIAAVAAAASFLFTGRRQGTR